MSPSKVSKIYKKKQRVPNGYFVEAHTWRQEAGGDSAQARSKRRRHLVAQGCALDTEQRAGAQRGVGKEVLHLGHPALADQLEGELAGHAGRQRVDLGGDERGVRLPGSRVLHPAHFGGNAQR